MSASGTQRTSPVSRQQSASPEVTAGGPGTNHTAGPWQVGKRYGNLATEILNDSGSRAIASVWTHERSDIAKLPQSRDDYQEVPELVANARLIAAAPDLLAACEALAAALRKKVPANFDSDDYLPGRLYRAAISKAKEASQC